MFAFRVDASTLNTMKQKAKNARLTLTDLIVLSVTCKQIITVPDLIETRKELYAIGRNLNQLTMLANMGRITVVDLADMKTEIDRCHQTLDSIRDRVQS